MLDTLRKPLFLIAAVLIIIAVLMEVGSAFGLTLNNEPPGLGIPYLALLDGLLAYTILLMAASLLIPERIQGRLQGVITLIVSLLVLLAAITRGFLALAKLIVMLQLLLSPIFGTLAYMVIFGTFAKGEAAIMLSAIMTMKLMFAGFLVFAHQRFVQNKGLVLLVLTSLLANVVISFLHGFVPSFLVSITDAVAAIVIVILAAVWAIVFLIGAIIAVVKAVV
jgi:hypothetical protein